MLAAAPGWASGGRQPATAQWAWDVAGRVQVDHGRFAGTYTRSGSAAEASYLRRAELAGQLTWRGSWRAAAGVELDSEYVRSVPEAFIGWRPDADLELRVGRIDPDFGLELSTSTSWTYGIERSALWDVAPDIAGAEGGTGLRADMLGRGWHASAGLYDKRDHSAATGRVVWMPRLARAQVVQLGASLSRSAGRSDDGLVRTRLAVRGVSEDAAGRRSTLAAAVDPPQRYVGDRAVGLEFAWQGGAWMLQAEWLRRRLLGRDGATDRDAGGTTLLAAWSPSGTPRRHDEHRARFGRPQFPGHWEVVFRADRLAVRPGGGARVMTAGLSWMPERAWRASVNLHRVHSDEANPAGDRRGEAATARVQFTF